MIKEFNLSDKIIKLPKGLIRVNNKNGLRTIEVTDVKEFIKLLKKTLDDGIKRKGVLPLDWAFDRIDELAGDELK